MSIAEINIQDDEYDKLIIESNGGGGMNFVFAKAGWDRCECSVMDKQNLLRIIDIIQEHLDETES